MRYRFTIPDSEVYSWESQIWQYRDAPAPPVGGITYYPGRLDDGRVVDCLLYWKPDYSGRLRIVGILNHYGWDSDLEQRGNVNIWVRRTHRRQGVATALWGEAVRRWHVNLDQQRFTRAGAALAEHLANRVSPAQPGESPTKG